MRMIKCGSKKKIGKKKEKTYSLGLNLCIYICIYKRNRKNVKMTNKHETGTLLLKLSLSICFSKKKDSTCIRLICSQIKPVLLRACKH